VAKTPVEGGQGALGVEDILFDDGKIGDLEDEIGWILLMGGGIQSGCLELRCA